MAERLRRVLLAALLVLPTPLLAAAALAPLERFYADTRTLAGQFTQTVTDASGVVSEESRGEFAIERPGRFRWDYRTPFEQIIVADGRELWVYEPDLDQATVRPVDEQTADAPGLLLAGARFPAELFDAVAEADGWLRLIPTRADSGLGSVRLQLTGAPCRHSSCTTASARPRASNCTICGATNRCRPAGSASHRRPGST